MKRRDFFKTSGAAAGLIGSLDASQALAAEDQSPATPKPAAAPPADNRPAEYLNRAKKDPFLPNQNAYYVLLLGSLRIARGQCLRCAE